MKTICFAFSMMLLVSAAQADDELFSRLDADGDGIIGEQEARASQAVSTGFVLIDMDQSGTIDPRELASAAGEPSA